MNRPVCGGLTPTRLSKPKQAGEAAAGAEVDEKQKLLEKLQAENKEMKDRVLRTLAEMENVRSIARR